MNIIIDTGPLIAFFDQSDQYNYYAGKEFSNLDSPFYTCEAVLTETIFLFQRGGINADLLFRMIEREDLIIKPTFNNTSNQQQIRKIIQNYDNLPASFTDACLVALSETINESSIFTLDKDFTIYRNSKGKPLSLINP